MKNEPKSGQARSGPWEDGIHVGTYAEEPGLLPLVFELLELVFPGIAGAATRAEALGASWESVSRPYVLFEAGRVVSHLGVIELPLIVEEKRVAIGSIHAVATHPERRRAGLFRLLMERALGELSNRYETLVLTTENPEYYERFGFRVVVEAEFHISPAAVARAASTRSGGSFPPMRPLDLALSTDLAILRRLLASRVPVSSICGVERADTVFLFNESSSPLWYAEDLDAISVFDLASGRLDLFDVVATDLPSWEELVARVPGDLPVSELVIHFPPDRICPRLDPAARTRGEGAVVRAVPRVFEHDGPSILMVRGPFLREGRAFSLPRSART